MAGGENSRDSLYAVDKFQAWRRRSFLVGNTSHAHSSSGTSPLLPLLLHTDLFAATCPVAVLVQSPRLVSDSWPIANGTWDKEKEDSVLCGSGSLRWAEFSVTSMLFLFREPEL